MKLSVVIPTFNRTDDLDLTLRMLSAQDQVDFEVLVIENGTPNPMLKPVCERHGQSMKLRYFHTPVGGVTFARALGDREAKAPIVLQMDDDVSVEPTDALAYVVAFFNRFPQAQALGLLEERTPNQGLDSDKLWNFEIKSTPPRIGQVDRWMNIRSGFLNLKSSGSGIYSVDACRSCFLAYRKTENSSSLWDTNYRDLGSPVCIREETDFIFRYVGFNQRVFYSTERHIFHRAAMRPPTRVRRGQGHESSYFYSAAHAYFAIKAFLESRLYFRIIPWIPYQLLWGSDKNRGALRWGKREGPRVAISSIAGFVRGALWGFFAKRGSLAGDFPVVQYDQNLTANPAPSPGRLGVPSESVGSKETAF